MDVSVFNKCIYLHIWWCVVVATNTHIVYYRWIVGATSRHASGSKEPWLVNIEWHHLSIVGVKLESVVFHKRSTGIMAKIMPSFKDMRIQGG